jgi:hypothetical protein
MEDVKADLKVSTLQDEAGDTWARVAESPQFAPILLATIVVWEFGVLLFEASKSLFWYDEIVTFHISALQPVSLLLRALKAGADAQPIGFYLIARAANMLPGDPLVTLRLPSIIGYLMTLLGVYWFVRKKMRAIAGLAAVLLIALSPLSVFALDARPYALMVGFFAISAVLWQRIDERRFMTPLFALFLTLAVSCHAYAVVAISFFAIAELTWTLMSRRIRWGVWAGCLLATAPFLIGLPNLLHVKELYGKNIWAHPGWRRAFTGYGYYVGVEINRNFPFIHSPQSVLILFFGLGVGYWLFQMMRQPRGMPERKFSLPEIILVCGFALYPALLAVLTKLSGGGYAFRYGWPGILGLVLGLVYLVRTIWLKPSSGYILAALLIAFAIQSGNALRRAYTAGSIRVLQFTEGNLLYLTSSTRVDQRWANLARFSRSAPSLPVVIGSQTGYLEAVEYSPPELRDRLVDVVNPDIALSLLGMDTADKNNRILGQFIPLHVEDLAPFQTAHERFILFSGDPNDWFTSYLIERGQYHLSPLSEDADNSIYLVER